MLKESSLLFFLGLFSVASITQFVQAAPAETIELGQAIGKRPLEAIITAPTAVEVGRLVVFDGTRSYNPLQKENPLRYFWEFGDEDTSIAAEVGHKFTKPGRYTVRLTVANEKEKTSAEKTIVVYKNRIFIISDETTDPRVINTFQTEAQAGNVLLDDVRTPTIGTDFGSERILIDLMKKKQAIIEESPFLILWTDRERGLSALTSFAQENESINFNDKTILIVTNDPVASLIPFGKIAFRVLDPQEIIISTPDAVYTSLLVKREALGTALKTAEKDFIRINEDAIAFRGYNFMSQGVIYLLAHGIPQHSLTLLLMLPLVATIAVIAKQVIGLNLMGIYIPSIITISLVAIGFGRGILILLAIIITSILFRKFARRWRMMYYPKMALAFIIITLVITIILGIAAMMGDVSLAGTSIFPLLVMILIAEKFTNVQIGKGFLGAVKAFGGTLVVAAVSYFLIEKIGFFKTFFLIHPEIILALLFVNYLIGQWRGLRLTEQWRFWDLRYYNEEEE